MKKPIKIFYSYSHLDLRYLERIKKNLSILRRDATIIDWGDRDINAGDEWKKAIDNRCLTQFSFFNKMLVVPSIG